MRDKLNAEFAMGAEEVIWRLTVIARANLKHYMSLGEDGQPTIAFMDTTEAQSYALN